MAKSVDRLKFEEAMRQLDAIVTAMESGEVGIEESISQYEQAMALAAHCRQILDHAEQRIRKIQLDAAGRPEAVPVNLEQVESAPPETLDDGADACATP